jgi:hypothetical protein
MRWFGSVSLSTLWKEAAFMTGSDQSARDTAASTQQGAQTAAPQGETGRQYVPRQTSRRGASEVTREPSGAAMGFTIAAAVLMMMSGVWNFLEGLAAIIRGSFVVVLHNYVFELSAAGWGWFHLILGAVVAIAGVALLTDKLWARIVGVALAAVSAIVNFLYIPYLPVWSIALIAIDVAIIWALLTPRRERGYI